MKRLILIATLAACSGTISHSGAVNMRYAGIVPIVGGALVAGGPVFNGDGLQPHTNEAGVALGLIGLVLIAVSLGVDPGESK